MSKFKVTISDVEKAYQREDEILSAFNDEVKRLENEQPNEHLIGRYDDDFTPDSQHSLYGFWYYRNWVNGCMPVNNVSLWHTHKNYNSSVKKSDVFEKSEKEKVLLKTDKFKISLVREYLDNYTETYYGYRFSKPVYMLFDLDNNIICKDIERWRFIQKATGTYKEKEVSNLFDMMKLKLSPFRYQIIKMTNTDTINFLCNKLDIRQDKPTNSVWQTMQNENYYCIFLLGKRDSIDYKKYNSIRDINATWFFVKSNNLVPTFEMCMTQLKSLFKDYDHNEYYECLMYQKDVLKRDMNQLDYEMEYRIHYVITQKFKTAIEMVFNQTEIKQILEIII